MNATDKNRRRLRNGLLISGLVFLVIGVLGFLGAGSRGGVPGISAVLPPQAFFFRDTATPSAPSGTDAPPPTPTFPFPVAITFPANTTTPYPLVFNDQGDSMPLTWDGYPAPTTWPSTPVPPPIGLIPIPDDQVNILLLGNDYRPKLGSRTDAIMLLTLNPSTGTASLTSFPRDLYVYAPGWWMMKLNTVQPRGGFDLMALTFEYNFGVRPDFYVNISMNSFVDVINLLGGIDVEVKYALSDPSLVDGRFSVEPGTVHMNGQMAKWYARSRNTTTVFSRDERQQAVIKAVFLKLMSIDGIRRAPELWDLFTRFLDTNLTLVDILPLTPLALQLIDTSRASQHSVSDEDTVVWITPETKAWVLLPIRERVLEVMLAALAP